MPIRPELRRFYPRHWPELSRKVRFERAGGRCQSCSRPHGATLRCLPDGRWFDPEYGTWRNGRGRPAPWPDLIEATFLRTTRVLLAAAHLDHDPANNRLRNLRSLCQRCHMLHDRRYHLAQRWLTYRRRYAIGDLFLGLYRPYRDRDGTAFVSLAYTRKSLAAASVRGVWSVPCGTRRSRSLYSDAITLWDCAPPGLSQDA
jgi:hypothetical protein